MSSGANDIISDSCKVDKKRIVRIRITYIINVLVWTFLVLYLNLVTHDPLTWLIISIPYIVAIVGFFNVCGITSDIEKELFQINVLSAGLLLILALISWLNKGVLDNRSHYMRILIVAIVIALLTQIDLWLPREWISVMKHVKSMWQTMALALIIYSLYVFFSISPENILG